MVQHKCLPSLITHDTYLVNVPTYSPRNLRNLADSQIRRLGINGSTTIVPRYHLQTTFSTRS